MATHNENINLYTQQIELSILYRSEFFHVADVRRKCMEMYGREFSRYFTFQTKAFRIMYLW